MKTTGGKEVLVKARDKKGHSLSSGQFLLYLVLFFLFTFCTFAFFYFILCHLRTFWLKQGAEKEPAVHLVEMTIVLNKLSVSATSFEL